MSPSPGRFCWFGSPAGGMPPHSDGFAVHQQLSTGPWKVRQPPTLAVAPPLLRSWRTSDSATPTRSSRKVSEIRPENSGVQSVLLSLVRESSYMALAAAVALKPGASSGRVVRMFMVAPMPPDGTSALPLL